MLRSDLITKTHNWLMPCAFLTQSIRDFIANLSPMDEYFNQNIIPYYRTDLPTQILPAMCIYISRIQTKGKYYYKNIFINIDIYLPIQLIHKQVDNMTHTILTWLDIIFKRSDFQNYISKYNAGVTDVAGCHYIAQNYNTTQLNKKYDVHYITTKFQVQFDRMIWADTLINKFGVSPANINMLYSFDYITDIKMNTIL